MSVAPSIAHKGEIQFAFRERYLEGKTHFHNREGRLHCEYCGSLHPGEVVILLKAGASIHFADWKYGWPHKAYLNNPWGKFYTRHLIDATPADRAYLERALGLHIDFDPHTQRVSWRPWQQPESA